MCLPLSGSLITGVQAHGFGIKAKYQFGKATLFSCIF